MSIMGTKLAYKHDSIYKMENSIKKPNNKYIYNML